jgi:hypothetical protein
MLEIYAAVVLFFCAGAVVVGTGLYLPAFLFACYMLPFQPLQAAMIGADTRFWSLDPFVFSADSIQVSRMSIVWLWSSLGMIAGAMLSRVRIAGGEAAGQLQPDARRARLGFAPATLSFGLAAALIFVRFRVGGAELESGAIHGFELLVGLTLLFCWVVAVSNRSLTYGLLALCLSAMYALSQIRSGDRDFLAIVIALLLFFMARRRRSWITTVAAGIGACALVVGGAVISMLRMEIDLSAEQLLTYIFFNSWNATILPVILMVEQEWDAGALLLGKTYLDISLSIVPTFVFQLFDAEKPIQFDNPALWFYIEGLGGMHAAGVALRNFGLAGVFGQSAVLMYALCKVERHCATSSDPWRMFFFLTIAGVLMHTVWYSLITLANALLFFSLLYVLFEARPRLLGRPRRSRNANADARLARRPQGALRE